MRCVSLLALAVILVLGAVGAAPATPLLSPDFDTQAELSAPAQPDSTPRQDGRDIPRLRWFAPRGEQPGSYADYRMWHTPRPASFANQHLLTPDDNVTGQRGRAPASIAILIDGLLYPDITASLTQYVADLTSEGYTVHVETVGGGTAAEIKDWIQDRYAAGCTGIIFVGDITAAWAEVSGDVFPSDLFYMDLDGHWEDADQDGDYEIHTAGAGDEGPELYVARMYAHTLNYDSEPGMVNGYLAKTHAYRAGTLTQPWRGLEYIDKDWYSMAVDLEPGLRHGCRPARLRPFHHGGRLSQRDGPRPALCAGLRPQLLRRASLLDVPDRIGGVCACVRLQPVNAQRNAGARV